MTTGGKAHNIQPDTIFMELETAMGKKRTLLKPAGAYLY